MPKADFELVTYRSVVNPLTDGTKLLENNFGNETIYKITLVFVVYFDKYYVAT